MALVGPQMQIPPLLQTNEYEVLRPFLEAQYWDEYLGVTRPQSPEAFQNIGYNAYARLR